MHFLKLKRFQIQFLFRALYKVARVTTRIPSAQYKQAQATGRDCAGGVGGGVSTLVRRTKTGLLCPALVRIHTQCTVDHQRVNSNIHCYNMCYFLQINT